MSSFERQSKFSREQQSPHLPPLEVFEKAATIPRGEPETFGSTPLDHGLAYTQQRELLQNLQELVDTDIPEDIPENIAEYMKDTFAARFHSRGNANHENYLTALHSCEEFADDPVASEVLSRAKLGHASPAELLLVRQMLGIRSAELACLTHPYGKRLEYITPMREAVRDSVELLGGTYDDEPETRYRVKGVVNEIQWEADYTEGFFMTRKRNLGVMPDGTVIRERTSFILRRIAIPWQNLQAIRRLDAKDSTWQDEAVKVGYLSDIADVLLEADEYSLVIPVSTTIYAFNPETAALIDVRESVAHEVRRRELEKDMAERFPALLAHLDDVRNGANKMPNTNDVKLDNFDSMLYVSHEDEDEDED